MNVRLSALIFCCSLLPAISYGFDELTPAQAWIYDKGHLANTQEGESLTYDYTALSAEVPVIEDVASLSVTASHEGGKRDVKVTFLNGDNAMLLPPFRGYRGNPMIIAMLEHIAQSMSKETGGGALYFRNRIRDSLASDAVEMQEYEMEYQDQKVPATVLTFYPFKQDQYLNESPEMKEARFQIELSDDVPGGLYRVEVSTQGEDKLFE
ncbi:MAG: hypothetical protein AB8B63_20475, partial [Granulosicoccus sp.]